MLKVKVFDAEHETDLENMVNEFLQTVPETQFKEVKFQVAAAEDADSGETVCCFSAMVLYRK